MKNGQLEQSLLPGDVESEHKRTSYAVLDKKNLTEAIFKCYVVAFAIFVWTGYTLLVAYTRQMTPKDEVFFFH
jgi:hypothetical protein